MKRIWWLAGFILASVLIRLPMLSTGFVSDDFEIFSIASRPHGILEVWHKPIGGNVYRPLGFTSLLLDQTIWHDQAYGFHLTSIVLHGINAALLAWLISHWFRRATIGGLAGILFLLYPANYEAVTWISGRFDVLALTFSLLALILYERHDRWRWFSALAVLAAGLTKEPAFILPIIFIIRQIGQKIPVRSIIQRVVPALLAVLVAFFLRAIVLGDPLGGYRVFGESIVKALSLTDGKVYLLTPLAMLAKSLNIIFTSVRLPFLKMFLESFWPSLIVLMAVTGLIIGCVRLPRKSVWPLVAATYVLLIPVVPLLRYVSRSLEGSRFWYAPSAALVSVLAIVLFGQRKKIAIVATTIVCTTMGLAFVVNGRPWQLAGTETRQIQKQFHNLSETINPNAFLVFQDIPDNRFGAYVFRRGFGEYLDTVFPGRFPDRVMINRTYAPDFSTCAEALQEQPRFVVLRWQQATGTFLNETPSVSQRLEENVENGHNKQVRTDWIKSRTIPNGIGEWTVAPEVLHQQDASVVFDSPASLSLSTSLPELPAASFAALQLNVTATAQRAQVPVSVYWKTNDGSYNEYQRHILFPIPATGQPAQVTVPLCTYVPWLVSGSLNGLRLQFSTDLQTLAIHSLTFSTP